MKMRETSRAQDKKPVDNNSQARSSNSSDSGTTNRVLEECLQFLHKNNGVFVVMTSNDITQLPPEFTRPGRVDVLWYFSLPTYEERKEIFRVHLGKTGKEISEELVVAGAQCTENYTGAEIQAVVKAALRKAFIRYTKEESDGNISEEDIKQAAGEVVPIYKSSREVVGRLEAWAKDRARYSNAEARAQEHITDSDEELLSELEL